MPYTTIEGTIGSTPLVELLRSTSENAKNRKNIILGKWECGNPSGSIKDRVLKTMIRHAEERGEIRPGDTLIEATGGNTGISLAMMAAARGYRSIVVMPESANYFKQQSIAVYGAKIVLTPKSGGIEYARDLAEQMAAAGEGVLLDQFNNSDNPLSHYETTGPEIWSATKGKITHFVCPMGTTGTIMGVSRFLNRQTEITLPGCITGRTISVPGFMKRKGWTRSKRSVRHAQNTVPEKWLPKKGFSADCLLPVLVKWR